MVFEKVHVAGSQRQADRVGVELPVEALFEEGGLYVVHCQETESGASQARSQRTYTLAYR
jgi:hypothetical protein